MDIVENTNPDLDALPLATCQIASLDLFASPHNAFMDAKRNLNLGRSNHELFTDTDRYECLSEQPRWEQSEFESDFHEEIHDWMALKPYGNRLEGRSILSDINDDTEYLHLQQTQEQYMGCGENQDCCGDHGDKDNAAESTVCFSDFYQQGAHRGITDKFDIGDETQIKEKKRPSSVFHQDFDLPH